MKAYIIIVIALSIARISSESNQSRNNKFLKIVGGNEATPHQSPFIVSLLLKKPGGYSDYCAGSLISDEWILTAAHCLYLAPKDIFVLAGHHDLKRATNSSQFRKVVSYFRHDNFKEIGPYDIGILRVDQPFEITDQVQIIEMSTSRNPKGSITAFGWGSTTGSANPKYPSKLQTAELSIVHIKYCRSRYSVTVSTNMNFCAGKRDHGRGTCVGDSGGPVVQKNKQVGIVSWGPVTCNSQSGPSVFTKLAYFIPWINEQMNKTTAGKPVENVNNTQLF